MDPQKPCTQVIRKHLSAIRKHWESNSETSPFLFTQEVGSSETIEHFCTEIVLQKYMSFSVSVTT